MVPRYANQTYCSLTRHASVCNTFHKPPITSIIDVEKTTTWGESGFPSEFLGSSHGDHRRGRHARTAPRGCLLHSEQRCTGLSSQFYTLYAPQSLIRYPQAGLILPWANNSAALANSWQAQYLGFVRKLSPLKTRPWVSTLPKTPTLSIEILLEKETDDPRTGASA